MAVVSLWAAELKDARVTLSRLLKELLARRVFDAIYVPLRTTRGDSVVPALVRDADLLDRADPLAPMMLINGARAVAALTVSGVPGRIAVVLRPCEIRALIELTKLKQASLEGLTVIGVDCAGTYEVSDYAPLQAEGVDLAVQLLARAAEGGAQPHDGYGLRPACQMCEYPTPLNAQITVGFIGVDGLMVEMDEERSEALGLTTRWPRLSQGDLSFRQDIIQRLVSEHAARRDETVTAFSAQVATPAALADYFATCQRCHNCMVACPICYCKECLFRTSAFEHQPDQYLRWAGRKKATRLPADTVLFHLTRLNHMATSCVGCGLCESACPSHIPLTVLFRTVGARTQALFDYVPGRRLEEEIPLMVFRETELERVT